MGNPQTPWELQFLDTLTDRTALERSSAHMASEVGETGPPSAQPGGRHTQHLSRAQAPRPGQDLGKEPPADGPQQDMEQLVQLSTRAELTSDTEVSGDLKQAKGPLVREKAPVG